MPVSKCRCPMCGAILKLSSVPIGNQLRCPGCDTIFQPVAGGKEQVQLPHGAGMAPSATIGTSQASGKRDNKEQTPPSTSRNDLAVGSKRRLTNKIVLLSIAGSVAALMLLGTIALGTIIVVAVLVLRSGNKQVAEQPPQQRQKSISKHQTRSHRNPSRRTILRTTMFHLRTSPLSNLPKSTTTARQ